MGSAWIRLQFDELSVLLMALEKRRPCSRSYCLDGPRTVPSLRKRLTKAKRHGSETVRDELIHRYPDLTDRVHATGSLTTADLSQHISACDVMLQPYIDGVSSRRTSVMAALSHGLPIVTAKGALTESIWAESHAVALVTADDVEGLIETTKSLLANASARNELGE